MQPQPQRAAALEARERAPGAQQHVLHRVVGVVDGAEHAVAVGVQLAPARGDERLEGVLVAGARGGEQLLLLELEVVGAHGLPL